MILEMEDFNFTIDNINKIRNLNSKLKKGEERIRPFAKQLNEMLNKPVAEKKINDFKILKELSVIRNNYILLNKLQRVE